MSLIFTVSPDFNTKHLAGWFVVNTLLQRQTGEGIHLETFDDFESLHAATAADQIDLIYANPFDAARLVERRARQVAPATLDRELGEGYGIYRGKPSHWAVLRFSADAARWVRAETWHPQQRTTELDDERLELQIPYSSTQELEMDILRHGEQVEVVSPPELRERIGARLRAAGEIYVNRQD